MIYVYYGNAGAAESNDGDTWNADHGLVYHLKEDPAGTAPQAEDSTANAVHGTYDIAGATVEDNTLWGGKCILFDNGPRLRVDDNPAIENANRITIEAWVNTLSWPTRAVVCRREGSYILYMVGSYDKDAGPDNQRLYLNGARVAQMSGTLPIDLKRSCPWHRPARQRHRRSVQWPYRRVPISHVQRSDGGIETTRNNMSDPGAFAAGEAERRERERSGRPEGRRGAGWPANSRS